MKAMTTMLLSGCLLVLAGVLADMRPAFGQSEEGCPVPAGATSLPNLDVTVSEVEADPSRLREFTLAARDIFGTPRSGTSGLDEAAYFGCLIRQEGGPWRSGSIYLTTLTPDGRVFTRNLHKSLVRELARPFNVGLFEYIGACVFASHG